MTKKYITSSEPHDRSKGENHEDTANKFDVRPLQKCLVSERIKRSPRSVFPTNE